MIMTLKEFWTVNEPTSKKNFNEETSDSKIDHNL